MSHYNTDNKKNVSICTNEYETKNNILIKYIMNLLYKEFSLQKYIKK